MAFPRVYCGVATAEMPPWLTVAIVDDAGRLLEMRHISDDPAGYAHLTALLARGADGWTPVAIDGHEHLTAQLLAAANRPLAVADPASAGGFADRFADDTSYNGIQAPPSQRRAVGLACALQAGVLHASGQIPSLNLDEFKPVLAAHNAAAAGRQAAAEALREVLRELYPAALMAYPDPADQVPLCVLEALPEPGLLSDYPSSRDRESTIVANLAASGVDPNAVSNALALLRAAVEDSPPPAGRVAPEVVAETVRHAVTAVRACDNAVAILIEGLAQALAGLTGGAYPAGGPPPGESYATLGPAVAPYGSPSFPPYEPSPYPPADSPYRPPGPAPYHPPSAAPYSPPGPTPYSPPSAAPYSPPGAAPYSPPGPAPYSPPGPAPYSPPNAAPYRPPAPPDRSGPPSGNTSRSYGPAVPPYTFADTSSSTVSFETDPLNAPLDPPPSRPAPRPTAEPRNGSPARPGASSPPANGDQSGGAGLASSESDQDLLIFSTTSAWFTKLSDGTLDGPLNWGGLADEGWRAAEQVAQPAVGAATSAGLPRRVPQANLVPGSARPPDRRVRIVRDPRSIADHTEGYFRGWRKGQEIGGFAVGQRDRAAWEFNREKRQRDNADRAARLR